MTKQGPVRWNPGIVLAMLVLAVTACGTSSGPSGQAGSATSSPSLPASPSAAATAGAWRIDPSPSPSNDNYLNGVACTSSNNCWAVGYYYNANKGSGEKTLIEHWNGLSWNVVAAPDPMWGDHLSGVACASVVDCWAVGGVFGGFSNTVIEHWNGESWLAVLPPFTVDGGSLNGVTCVSASDCWAVGYHAVSESSGTLIEHWDGGGWTIVPSEPYYGLNGLNTLNAVSCLSAVDCWAVGEIVYRQSTTSVMEHWNGTSWVALTVSPPEEVGSDLADVSCVSPEDCWAVGGTLGDQVGHFDHWNGTSWTMVAEPALPGEEPQLETLQCLSADACWAVGIRGSPTSEYATLIAAAWNGDSWSPEPIVMPPTPPLAPPDGGPGVLIARIACVSPSFCVGVGSRPQPNGDHASTLIEALS